MRNRTFALALFALGLQANPAAAGLQRITCVFDVGCRDTAPCTQTDHAIEVTYRTDPTGPEFIAATPTDLPPSPFTVEVTDASGGFRAAPITAGGWPGQLVGFMGFAEDGTRSLFTVAKGIGRYSIHMIDTGAATYFEGSCTEEND